jgi:hypothetical protein
MNAGHRYIDHLSMMVKRALEGKMGPFNFMVILGFFSSLVLLYISLHVHLEGISTRIEEGTRHRQALEDEKIDLVLIRNDLLSADRIIPMAEAAGMRPGTPDQIHRVAYCGPDDIDDTTDRERARWVLRGGKGGIPSTPAGVPESK